MQSYWLSLRVIATFVGLIVFFFVILTWGPIVDRFDIGAELARLAAWSSFGVLKALGAALGFELHRNGTIIGSGDFGVDIAPACSGAVPTSIYLAAVLAFPSTWRSRLIGSGLGFLIIHLVNVVRVVVLFLIGVYFREIFHETHVYVAQALVICVAVALWLYWAGRFADAPAH